MGRSTLFLVSQNQALLHFRYVVKFMPIHILLRCMLMVLDQKDQEYFVN